MRKNPEQRFWEKVEVSGPDECWEWQAAKVRGGYGTLRINGKNIGAHRFAYELQVGPVPIGLMVLHHCDNPPCCNPMHLFLGTSTDNMGDKVRKGRAFTGSQKGECNGNARLTGTDIRKVHELSGKGWTQKDIGRYLNVSQTHIGYILLGKRWA